MAFSLDSKLVVSGSVDKTVKIWDAATGSLQRTLEGHGNPVHSVAFWSSTVAFSPDSELQTPHLNQDQGAKCFGYGYDLSSDGSWIKWNEYNVLWLPPNLRPHPFGTFSFTLPSTTSTAVTFALGCDSGRVILIGFSTSGPSLTE